MKRLVTALALAATTTLAIPALAADVGVSISIGQPGFYGQIDLGNMSRPPVLYGRPIMIERQRRGYSPEPLYLRVPPGHARNWRRYCGNYNACGRPVYFVKDNWYNDVYAPRYRAEHREDRRDERREDRHDRRDNDDNGNNGHRGN
jgi:hypothetical protein